MSEIALSPILPEDIEEVLRLFSDPKGYWQALAEFDEDTDNPLIELLRDNGEPTPLRSILTVIHKRYNGFGIIETPYLDVEFWDSHSGFYGTCFTSLPRECVRIHFFSAREGVPGEGLPQRVVRLLLSGASEKKVEKLVEYCGYTVIRPISSNVVGRTAIKFDARSTNELEKQGLTGLERIQGTPLLKTSQQCSATVLNAHFRLYTPEFIQQDPQLGQCATASLWVAGNIAAKKFGSRQLRFPNITKNAYGEKLPAVPAGYANIDPASGLFANEIKNALTLAGSSYHCQSYYEDIKDKSILQATIINHFVYSYVESGLPVILCLDPKDEDETTPGHAVAAVGHFLPEGVSPALLTPLDQITGTPTHNSHRIVSSAISTYYVHDDCNGPFNKLKISVELETPLIRVCPSGNGKACIDHDTEEMFVANCCLNDNKPAPVSEETMASERYYLLREAIVPVHFRVRMTSWESLMFAVNRHEEWEPAEIKDRKYLYIWRSFLITGSEFKRSLSARKFSYKTKKFYASIHMPKYIWVHEYTKTTEEDLIKCFPSTDVPPRMIHGEFIFDATMPKTNVLLSVTSVRMEDILFAPTKDEIVFDEKSKDYPCFRHSDIHTN